jgi:predicted RND superfamily exporter protein
VSVTESYTLDADDGKLRPALGRAIFAVRLPLIFVFIAATAFFLWQASQLKPDASFEKMIPVSHPYIVNFLDSRDDLKGLGNSVRIIVESKRGDIFSAAFQETLREITDEVFYVNGVDRSALQSLWTPNVRWQEVTEEGFVGGAVIPDDYDGSERTLDKLRDNTLKSGQIGRLVANDFRSAIIVAPLVEVDPNTGERLDYQAFAQDLERLVRDKYQSEDIGIRITGFAKLIGDLIDGASLVGMFFLVAFVVTAVLLFAYSRCGWLTFASLLCSTTAVVWQMGLLRLMGMGLDPYSMLVPFLVFAVGISHSVQIINRFGHFIYHHVSRIDAARLTFVRLSKPGFIALLSDGVGFLTLRVIDIPVIRELAVVASTGIAVLILTNLVLLPLVLSYTGISDRCVRYRADKDHSAYSALAAAEQGDGAGARTDDPRRMRWSVRPRYLVRAVPADRRSRSRRAGTAAGVTLQPRQRLPHGELLHQYGCVRGHGATQVPSSAAAIRSYPPLSASRRRWMRYPECSRRCPWSTSRSWSSRA